ncbi:MAG: hypothetical protein WB507_14180 [Solirubrobacterales bacterium]
MGLLLAPALLAAPAQATPLTPALTGTNPPSPGASLTPRILGQAEGVITSVVRKVSTSTIGGRIAMATGSGGDTVTIYANERECLSPEAIAAEGTATQLEHEGIEVTVKPDSVTTFYATLSKEGEFSPCTPKGITYRQVTTPPSPPTLSSVTPASPANDNLPHLLGSAAAESVVSIYTTPGCSGSPVATGSAAEFSAGGIQTPVPDNSTTTFHARASLGGIFSQCSETSVEYQEVTPPPPPPPPPPSPPSSPPLPHQEPELEGLSGPGGPPAPHLRTIPGVRSNDHTPLVTGTAPGAVTVRIYESAGCSGTPVAKGSAAQFASGFPVAVSENAATSFYAVSVGSNEIRSACSAPISYFEDSILPRTRITMGPGTKTRKRSPVFRFADISGDPAATSFRCRVNRGGWKPCSAPFHLRHLRFRSYVLFVKGIDALGNEERVGAKWHFKVVRHP